MEVKFEYFKNHFITFDLHTINFLVGPNRKIKQQLLTTINREKAGKCLSQLEENYYGDDGINIFCDDKVINHRNIHFKLIESLKDFDEELTFNNKDTLLATYLNDLENDFNLQKSLMKLNDMLITLANAIQNKINDLSDNQRLNIDFAPLTYNDLLKSRLLLSFDESDNSEDDVPVTMAQSTQVVQLFINLLKNDLVNATQPYWLFLTNLRQIFATDKEVNYFITQLRDLTSTNLLLKVFVILDDYPQFKMNEDDIERTIYLGDFIKQLPAFWQLKRSLSLHYPYELKLSNKQLVNAFYRVINYAGQDIENVYLKDQDMLLLKTLNEIL